MSAPATTPGLRQLDHLVLAVPDLARAIDDFRARGFTVMPGGQHPGRTSHNALVVFADGAYLATDMVGGHGDVTPAQVDADVKTARAMLREAAPAFPTALGGGQGLRQHLPATLGEVLVGRGEPVRQRDDGRLRRGRPPGPQRASSSCSLSPEPVSDHALGPERGDLVGRVSGRLASRRAG